MPVYVNEVVIQVEVGPPPAGSAPAPTPAAASQQALIDQCVERVLEILREREEP